MAGTCKENGSGRDAKKGNGRKTPSLLHRAFRRIILIISPYPANVENMVSS